MADVIYEALVDRNRGWVHPEDACDRVAQEALEIDAAVIDVLPRIDVRRQREMSPVGIGRRFID